MNDATILLVEDNPDDVLLTIRAFKKNNIDNEIVVATDGECALDLLQPQNGQSPLQPVLVLLDVKIPKIDGLTVLRRIRTEPATQPLPVVVLTTSSEERDIVESYRLGANSYVRKPVVFSEFIEATKVLGLYWLLLNQPPPNHRGG